MILDRKVTFFSYYVQSNRFYLLDHFFETRTERNVEDLGVERGDRHLRKFLLTIAYRDTHALATPHQRYRRGPPATFYDKHLSL
jgi:hypothetical protein